MILTLPTWSELHLYFLCFTQLLLCGLFVSILNISCLLINNIEQYVMQTILIANNEDLQEQLHTFHITVNKCNMKFSTEKINSW